MLYLRCLQAFSDNLQSCHFPVYHSINSYIFLSKFSNFLVIISLENRLSKNLIIRLFLILFSIILSYYASFAILFPKYCTASSTVSIYFSQIGILPFSILIATLLSSFSLWTKHFYLPMTIYNFIHCHRQIKLQYRWQFSTLPTSVLHRH